MAYRCMRSVGRTWARSYFDRGCHSEENQHLIQVFERKQTCRKQLPILDGRTVGRVAVGAGSAAQRPRAAGYGLSHIPIHYADKAQTEREARDMHSLDGASSAIGMGHSSRNGAKQRFGL